MKNRRNHRQMIVSATLIFALYFGVLPFSAQTTQSNDSSNCNANPEKCKKKVETNPSIKSAPTKDEILPGSQNPGSLNENNEIKKENPSGYKNSIEMEFVRIPAGEFLMGSSKGAKDEVPIRKVRISKPFLLGKFEVKQVEWARVMGNNPSSFSECGDCPVEQVSWDDVQIFLRKLSESENKFYRLPTEAEWEYAAKAGSDKAFQFGDTISQKDANVGDTARGVRNNPDYKGKPITVGSYKPNAWGLYDMHGNVWEWCEDFYGKYNENETVD
ncbi:MAG TPA: formylglycine-generating enzyme family protein, partial [Pyrinomonadaceae bacterium]|nr:formylglycine-generating enzyme family protein [Pyrinomonadaceae bacterium]